MPRARRARVPTPGHRGDCGVLPSCKIPPLCSRLDGTGGEGQKRIRRCIAPLLAVTWKQAHAFGGPRTRNGPICSARKARVEVISQAGQTLRCLAIGVLRGKITGRRSAGSPCLALCPAKQLWELELTSKTGIVPSSSMCSSGTQLLPQPSWSLFLPRVGRDDLPSAAFAPSNKHNKVGSAGKKHRCSRTSSDTLCTCLIQTLVAQESSRVLQQNIPSLPQPLAESLWSWCPFFQRQRHKTNAVDTSCAQTHNTRDTNYIAIGILNPKSSAMLTR